MPATVYSPDRSSRVYFGMRAECCADCEVAVLEELRSHGVSTTELTLYRCSFRSVTPAFDDVIGARRLASSQPDRARGCCEPGIQVTCVGEHVEAPPDDLSDHQWSTSYELSSSTPRCAYFLC